MCPSSERPEVAMLMDFPFPTTRAARPALMHTLECTAYNTMSIDPRCWFVFIRQDAGCIKRETSDRHDYYQSFHFVFYASATAFCPKNLIPRARRTQTWRTPVRIADFQVPCSILRLSPCVSPEVRVHMDGNSRLLFAHPCLKHPVTHVRCSSRRTLEGEGTAISLIRVGGR